MLLSAKHKSVSKRQVQVVIRYISDSTIRLPRGLHKLCDILKPFVKSFAVQETSKQDVYKVLPDTGVVIGFQYKEQLAGVKTDTQRIAVVEHFLISRMTNTEPDKLVLAALGLIHKSKGNIRITELMEQLHISQSSLENRFRQVVGATPKKFASILRLKNVMLQYDTVNSLTELGYESGFYDQAHFIKQFKIFTGDTPKKFFSDKK